jgi:hypothetical protein
MAVLDGNVPKPPYAKYLEILRTPRELEQMALLHDNFLGFQKSYSSRRSTQTCSFGD